MRKESRPSPVDEPLEQREVRSLSSRARPILITVAGPGLVVGTCAGFVTSLFSSEPASAVMSCPANNIGWKGYAYYPTGGAGAAGTGMAANILAKKATFCTGQPTGGSDVYLYTMMTGQLGHGAFGYSQSGFVDYSQNQGSENANTLYPSAEDNNGYGNGSSNDLISSPVPVGSNYKWWEYVDSGGTFHEGYTIGSSVIQITQSVYTKQQYCNATAGLYTWCAPFGIQDLNESVNPNNDIPGTSGAPVGWTSLQEIVNGAFVPLPAPDNTSMQSGYSANGPGWSESAQGFYSNGSPYWYTWTANP